MLKKYSFYFFCGVVVLLLSCNEDYTVISTDQFNKFVVLDTLRSTTESSVYLVGTSATDKSPRILVKNSKMYLFGYDSSFEQDSIVYNYDLAFVIDSNGSFRKNGIWVYSDFYTEGTFPFQTKGIKFNVDSIPPNWRSKVPTTEGIYFYENNVLNRISKEQSNEQFNKIKKDGFYFFPKSGRLYTKINSNKLE
ncbi:MAG: hypothetical protein ACSHWV_10400 [Cellulophaga fucicola]